MNNNYRLNFYILGIEDEFVDQIDPQQLEIKRKGAVWNKRTGKQYVENIAKKTILTTYEAGFQPAVDQLIKFIKENEFVNILLQSSREVSLQVCVDLDDECRVPYIRFGPEQLDFFSKIQSDIDFHIS